MLHSESSALGTHPSETEHTTPDVFGRSPAEWLGERLRERRLPAAPAGVHDLSAGFAQS